MSTKKYFPQFDQRLIILLISQALSGATVPVLFLISGLLGPALAPSLKLSTLPMSLVVVGVAVTSPIATLVMSRYGRKYGHISGMLLTLIGVIVSAYGLFESHFYLFNLGCLLSGGGASFNNQIRFTAAEGTTTEKALVHSWVLMFNLFAAIVGPGLVRAGQKMIESREYLGSLSMLAIMLLGVLIMMFWLPSSTPLENTSSEQKSEGYTSQVLKQANFWLAAIAGISSFATMTLIMSATPLQMHQMEHFSSADTTMTIQSHIIAMFFPSLFSGFLLSWLGVRKLIGLGVSLFLGCIVITYFHHEFHHYWLSLVLLGVGWNFLFLAGSAMISINFSGPDRFAAQGLNDTLVYGIQSISSLAAGWLLFEVGWKNLVLLPVPLLLGLLGFVFIKKIEPKGT